MRDEKYVAFSMQFMNDELAVVRKETAQPMFRHCPDRKHSDISWAV
jgi:hypothetical protein